MEIPMPTPKEAGVSGAVATARPSGEGKMSPSSSFGERSSAILRRAVPERWRERAESSLAEGNGIAALQHMRSVLSEPGARRRAVESRLDDILGAPTVSEKGELVFHGGLYERTYQAYLDNPKYSDFKDKNPAQHELNARFEAQSAATLAIKKMIRNPGEISSQTKILQEILSSGRTIVDKDGKEHVVDYNKSGINASELSQFAIDRITENKKKTRNYLLIAALMMMYESTVGMAMKDLEH